MTTSTSATFDAARETMLVLPFARRAIFEDIPYDFRSKVTSKTMAVVTLYIILTAVTGKAPELDLLFFQRETERVRG